MHTPTFTNAQHAMLVREAARNWLSDLRRCERPTYRTWPYRTKPQRDKLLRKANADRIEWGRIYVALTEQIVPALDLDKVVGKVPDRNYPDHFNYIQKFAREYCAKALKEMCAEPFRLAAA